MQVFIVGSPLKTAEILDIRRLNKQIIECDQILAAIAGKTNACANHPCTIQYRKHTDWLGYYRGCLKSYKDGNIMAAIDFNKLCNQCKPNFHNKAYLTNMKRRLYTKDPEHYKRWESHGESYENWYWIDNKWKIYKQNKN